MSGAYLVVIIVRDGWWSDQRPCPNLAAAKRHRAAVARRWNTSETAIMAPDGRVLAYAESLAFQHAIGGRQ